MHDLVERFFSAKKRKTLAKSGAAMKDGSFPIQNKEDLQNARRLAGHSKNPSSARAHIEKRAKALGLETHSQQEGLEVFFANLREAIRDIVKLYEEEDTGGDDIIGSLDSNNAEDRRVKAAVDERQRVKQMSAAANDLSGAFSNAGHNDAKSFVSEVMSRPGLIGSLASKLGVKLLQTDQKHQIVHKIAKHIRENPHALSSFSPSDFIGKKEAPSDPVVKNVELAKKTGNFGPLSVAATPPPEPRLRPAGGGAIGLPQGATSALEGPRTQKQGRITSVGEKGTETISLTPDQIRAEQQKGVRHMVQLVTPKSLSRPVERQKGLDLPDFGEAPKPSTQKPENISAEELKKSVQARNELRMAVKRANDALKSKK